jgi:hypothetical protein
MKDKCCCCEQRERFRREAEANTAFECIFCICAVLLLMIPIWGWLILIAIWLINKCKRTTLVIIAAILSSFIWIMGKEISKHNEEAERYNKQRERLEAAWPLK